MDRPIIFSAPMVRALLAGRKTQTRRLATSPLRKCEPGDRLYVRENFAIVPASAYRMSEGVEQTGCPTDRYFAAIYAAGWDRSIPKWRPSIHMPRWASRLTLVVEAVRVEPLQAITSEDAIAEGVVDMGQRDGAPYSHCIIPEIPDLAMEHEPETVYASLWERLHGEGSWSANPDVVALTFRVERGNIDRLAA